MAKIYFCNAELSSRWHRAMNMGLHRMKPFSGVVKELFCCLSFVCMKKRLIYRLWFFLGASYFSDLPCLFETLRVRQAGNEKRSIHVSWHWTQNAVNFASVDLAIHWIRHNWLALSCSCREFLELNHTDCPNKIGSNVCTWTLDKYDQTVYNEGMTAVVYAIAKSMPETDETKPDYGKSMLYLEEHSEPFFINGSQIGGCHRNVVSFRRNVELLLCVCDALQNCATLAARV